MSELISGIYTISSISHPSKIYIGSAVNFKNRFYRHKNELQRGVHSNPLLQNHANKYAISDLHFSPILFCQAMDLLSWEQFFIDYLRPSFNICWRAESRLGVKHTQAARNKIKLSWLYRPPITMESRLMKMQN